MNETRARLSMTLAGALLLLSSTALGAEGESTSRAVRRPEGVPFQEGGGRGDGVYGCFDGEFSLSGGVGVEADLRSDVLRPLVQATLRFYQAIGITTGFSQSVESTDPLERSLRAGIVIEPLFLLRWPNDDETGRALFDLTLDSIGLNAAVVFVEPKSGAFADVVAFDLGLGAGVPLQGTAPGLWLRTRGDVRLSDADPTFLLQLALEWQGFFASSWLCRTAR